MDRVGVEMGAVWALYQTTEEEAEGWVGTERMRLQTQATEMSFPPLGGRAQPW